MVIPIHAPSGAESLVHRANATTPVSGAAESCGIGV